MFKKIINTLLFILISLPVIADENDNLSPMELYKPSYFIFGDSKDQVKVQLSFKYALLKKYQSGLFMGYSQYMMWNLYDKSSPFYDINYNPEVFFKSKYFLAKYLDYIQIAPYEHMSNGRDGEESRSIDRIYIELQSSVSGKVSFGVNLKGYCYYSTESNNKDYTKYSNYYTAKFFVSLGDSLDENSKDELYIKIGGFKKGFIESGIISRKLWKLNPRLYFQVYHGYLSTMLDYNEKNTQIRIGVIFK